MSEIKLPSHINCIIEHNPHVSYFETIEQFLNRDLCKNEISIEERQKCIDTGEVWIIQIYPVSNASFYISIASTLQKALELIND